MSISGLGVNTGPMQGPCGDKLYWVWGTTIRHLMQQTMLARGSRQHPDPSITSPTEVGLFFTTLKRGGNPDLQFGL